MLSGFNEPNSRDLFTDGISTSFILEQRNSNSGLLVHKPATHSGAMAGISYWRRTTFFLMHLRASYMYFEPTPALSTTPDPVSEVDGFLPETKWSLRGFRTLYSTFTHPATNRHRHSMNLLFNVFNHFLFKLLTNHILSEALAFFPSGANLASWLVGFEIFHGWEIVRFWAFFGTGYFCFFCFFAAAFHHGLFFPFSFPFCVLGMETWEERFIIFLLGNPKSMACNGCFSFLAGAGGFTQLNLVWGGCLADCGNENDGGCE